MENENQRYKGTVVSIHPNHAFIGLGSITKLDGSPADLEIMHDIFVHWGDFLSSDFKVGMELSFEVREDWRSNKEGALKAVEVILGGLELKFPLLVVDHPTVPISWRFSQTILDHIKANRLKTFALIVGAVMPGNFHGSMVLDGNIGLNELQLGRGFVDFYAPGSYQVCCYLVEYDRDEGTLRKAFRKVRTRDYWPIDPHTGAILIKDSINLPFLNHDEVKGKVIALSELALSVPDGIFAKPMTGWKKKWFCYFWKEDLLDDCDRRGKLAITFTIGFPAYVVWELIKRIVFLCTAVYFFLIGFNSWPMVKAIFQRKLSVVPSDVELTLKSFTNYGGARNMLRPGVVIAFLYAIWYTHRFNVVTQATNMVMSYNFTWVTKAALFGFLSVFVWIVVMVLRKDNEEELTELEKQKQDERFATFEKAVTSAASANPKPVSVALVWSGVKRALCRNYRRG